MTQKERIKKSGCPCGMQGECCESPKTFNPEHVCSDEVICEDCYILECRNCHRQCGHEI